MHHRKNGSFSMLRTLPKTTLPNLRSEYLFNYVLSKDWIKNFAFTPLFSHYSLHSKFLIKTRLKTLFSLKATQGAMVTLSNANSKHCQRNTCFVDWPKSILLKKDLHVDRWNNWIRLQLPIFWSHRKLVRSWLFTKLLQYLS